jgi:hypothetical protein
MIPGLLWRGSSAQNFFTDSSAHPPPTTGPYAYWPPHGTFGPGEAGELALGGTYVDPVFGGTIKRLSDDFPTNSVGGVLYARNGWWNADGTYIVHKPGSGMVAIKVADATTKSLTDPGSPHRDDATCDPVDPDVFYYGSGNTIKKQLISTGAVSTLKDFGSAVGSHGGSLDWISNDGRYFLVKLAAGFRIWDKNTDTLYTGTITDAIGGGYCTMDGDARYVILVNGTTKKRYAISHGTTTLTTTGTSFSTLASDHADIINPSDGNIYMCRAIDDTNPIHFGTINIETGATNALLSFGGSQYYHQPSHYSAIPRGPMKDWCLFETTVSTGGGDTEWNKDVFGAANPVSSWVAFRNEVCMVNVLTGECRRFAHHRSRECNPYSYQPRPSVNWDGTKVAWMSNYGYDDGANGDAYSDMYMIDVPQ